MPEPRARQRFYNRRQQASESVEDYLAALRGFAKSAFPRAAAAERDCLILDQAKYNITDVEVARFMLMQPPSSVAELVALVRAVSAWPQLHERRPVQGRSAHSAARGAERAFEHGKPQTVPPRVEPGAMPRHPFKEVEAKPEPMARVSHPPLSGGSGDRSLHFKRHCKNLN